MNDDINNHVDIQSRCRWVTSDSNVWKDVHIIMPDVIIFLYEPRFHVKKVAWQYLLL